MRAPSTVSRASARAASSTAATAPRPSTSSSGSLSGSSDPSGSSGSPGSPGPPGSFGCVVAPVPPVSPLLRRLAAERATGAFTRDWGTLFLVDGQVAHAESPAAPGLDVLLTTGGGLPREGWSRAVEEAGAERRVGRHLVETGRVPGGVLELCQLGALYDAAFFVLAPGGGPGRFRRGTRHWLGTVRTVSAEAVERETLRRRALLDRVWPDASTDVLPAMRTAHASPVRVPVRRRPVLELVDGSRTAFEIARGLGRPAFHILIDLRQLAAAGLVTPVGRGRARAVTPPGPGADTGAETGAVADTGAGADAGAGAGSGAGVDAQADAAVGVPAGAARHVPPPAAGPLGQVAPQDTAAPSAPPTEFADPDVALLRRLRDALEAL